MPNQPKVIQLHDYKTLISDPNVIVGIEEITPKVASEWLRCNRLNRPVRRGHVAFLAREMEEGLWQLNGQAIIISSTEDVLDGQHRLLAVIESGVSIRTLVVYGVEKDAFKTIDTGAKRSGSDALSVWFPGRMAGVTKAVSTAVNWCVQLERGSTNVKGAGGGTSKISNTETIDYVNRHPSLWKCAETVAGYEKQTRLLSIGVATALYEMFQRRSHTAADEFMRDLCTGEMLKSGSPAYVLRVLLAKDQRRLTTYPMRIKVRMCLKAWNLFRRGLEDVSNQMVAVNANDPDKIDIL
jgi:hypothetical protein